MGLNRFQRLSFLIILLAIVLPSIQVDWQGTGNMNQTVMSKINNLIISNPLPSSFSRTQVDTIAQNVSKQLNNLWDPAWNVIISYQCKSCDSVVYGYAFNDHWMWINGLPASQSSYVWSYIIWKDYNCKGWNTIDNLTSLGTTFADDNNIRVITTSYASKVVNDVWGFAFNFVQMMEISFGGAFAMVASQDNVGLMGGYICLFNRNFYSMSAFAYESGNQYGSYFLFQTRSQFG